MPCLAPQFAAGVLGPVIAACSYIYYYYSSASAASLWQPIEPIAGKLYNLAH